MYMNFAYEFIMFIAYNKFIRKTFMCCTVYMADTSVVLPSNGETYRTF